MSDFGAMARRHWETQLPDRYREIPDPEAFFAKLGRQVAEEIDALALELEGPDRPGESYLERVGRLGETRSRAREMVLAERVFPAPEQVDDPGPPTVKSLPVVVSPGDPLWEQILDEERRARETLSRGPAGHSGR